jgi:hypothetical protein
MHPKQRPLGFIVLSALFTFSSCRSTNAHLEDQPARGPIRFGTSKTPCPGARIIPHPSDSRTAITVIHQDVATWDLARGTKVSEWQGSNISNAHDAMVLGQRRALLLADEFGVTLRNLNDGQTTATFDYAFGVRDLIYYTLGTSRDERLAAATGPTTWPHKIPDATGLGFSSEEWDDALSVQEQKLLIMDLEHGKTLGSVKLSDSFVHTVRFSPDQTYAITISYLAITFWDIKDPTNIKLSKKISISELAAGQIPAKLIATAAISSDLRLASLSTDAGLFVVDLQQQKIATALPGAGQTGIRLIRYLTWSLDNRSVFGSDLQGTVTTWSVTPAAVQYLKTYQLGIGSGHSGIFASSTSGEPHPNFVVDPNLKYYIHPGPIDEHAFGQCRGFEVAPL